MRESQEVTTEQPQQQQQEVQEQQKLDSFKKKREKTKILMDETHFYNYDELVSQPVVSQDSNLSPSLLQL